MSDDITRDFLRHVPQTSTITKFSTIDMQKIEIDILRKRLSHIFQIVEASKAAVTWGHKEEIDVAFQKIEVLSDPKSIDLSVSHEKKIRENTVTINVTGISDSEVTYKQVKEMVDRARNKNWVVRAPRSKK